MKSNLPSEIPNVPHEIFQLLDPIEQIVIRAQAARGEVMITGAPEEV